MFNTRFSASEWFSFDQCLLNVSNFGYWGTSCDPVQFVTVCDCSPVMGVLDRGALLVHSCCILLFPPLSILFCCSKRPFHSHLWPWVSVFFPPTQLAHKNTQASTHPNAYEHVLINSPNIPWLPSHFGSWDLRTWRGELFEIIIIIWFWWALRLIALVLPGWSLKMHWTYSPPVLNSE